MKFLYQEAALVRSKLLLLNYLAQGYLEIVSEWWYDDDDGDDVGDDDNDDDDNVGRWWSGLSQDTVNVTCFAGWTREKLSIWNLTFRIIEDSRSNHLKKHCC